MSFDTDPSDETTSGGDRSGTKDQTWMQREFGIAVQDLVPLKDKSPILATNAITALYSQDHSQSARLQLFSQDNIKYKGKFTGSQLDLERFFADQANPGDVLAITIEPEFAKPETRFFRVENDATLSPLRSKKPLDPLSQRVIE